MIRQRSVGVLTIGLALASATQVFAWQNAYHVSLGRPVAHLGIHRLYAPTAYAGWLWRWGWKRPSAFQVSGSVGVILLALGALLVCRPQGAYRRGSPPPMQGHGTTTWATERDIRESGLRAKGGMVLGASRGRVLRFDGPENVLLVGPQRQGKGVGVIIPSLLELPGHVVVIDVRGETWDHTAGYRSTFSRCLRLSLTQPGSACFNLLRAIRRGQHTEFMDAALLASMCVDPGHNKPELDHWEKTAQSLITCGMLYEVHRNPQPSMSGIASFWSQPGRSTVATLQHIVHTAPTQQVAELAQEVLNKAGNEASGVLSSMMTQLFLFRDPTLAANTRASDFTLEDFTRRDRFTSLYIVLSPGEEEHLRPFLRMFLRLALQRWLEMGSQKHCITLVLDEFTSWGRMPFFVNNLAVLGGRGIRTLIAVQNVPQLRDTYGHADIITEQCKVRVFFAANGQTTGSEISRQTGTGTATTMQESWRSGGLFRGQPSMQAQQHARHLLTDAEAMQIPAEQEIIQVAGYPPIWGTKLRFWEHKSWRERSQIPASTGVRP
jgi:type IV secretion system protein VirD4